MSEESTPAVERGFNPGLSFEEAEELVRVPVRIKDSHPDPELAPVSCHDCGKRGYQAVCYVAELDKELPLSWRAVVVCTDCADRDDPLCGLEFSDLNHPALPGGVQG